MFNTTHRRAIEEDDGLPNPHQRLRSNLFDLPIYQNGKKVSFGMVISESNSSVIEQLRESLNQNKRDADFIEFVILLQNDSKIIPQIRSEFNEQIDTGYLRIGLYPPKTDMAKLKNACFSLSTGYVLIHLEWAQLSGVRMGNYVLQDMQSCPNTLAFWFHENWRTSSKIAFPRDVFFELGGFDENLFYKKQITNFLSRMIGYGIELKVIKSPFFTTSIQKEKFRMPWLRKAKRLERLPMTDARELNIELIE